MNPHLNSDEDSPLDESDFSGTVLRCINQMLMEEDMEEKSCMLHDSLALQAAEKSFYEVIVERYPSSAPQRQFHNAESPDENLSGNFSDLSSTGTSNSISSSWSNADFAEYKPSIPHTVLPDNFVFKSSSTSNTQSSMSNLSSFTNGNSNDGFNGSSINGVLGSALLSENELLLQFQRGVKEASKFLPKDNLLTIDLEDSTFTSSFGKASQAVVRRERDDNGHLSIESKERKIHKREDETDIQDWRSNKQSAVYMDDSELSELFDKVLLCTGCGEECASMGICHGNHQYDSGMSVQQNDESKKSRVRKQNNKMEVVDLRTLLILCAQAVSSDDHRTANDLLKQVRQHSSPFGDGTQRLAYFFANALDARLAGTGTQIYTALSSKRTSAADMVKAYQMFIEACPFRKLAIMFANVTIMHTAKEVEALHIIDLGIGYGFQWPAFIYRLSKRPGGPPKLRVTGIEPPQSGFRPSERVEETGRRLAKYCERFNVPFQFNAIAKKWETILIEDLKLKENELLAVNCLAQHKNLPDETVLLNSTRDGVLNLVRRTNPSIFVHTIVNGCYNAPFFVTRFKEALFHYSTLFDTLDTNVAREDPMRVMFEREFFGREVMNIIACEGCDRVERPETYKQWQVRNMRAGFRQLPLDPQLINRIRGRLRGSYHPDFMLDQDGEWMLQGWKGRIICASSCWVPA